MEFGDRGLDANFFQLFFEQFQVSYLIILYLVFFMGKIGIIIVFILLDYSENKKL